MKDAVGNAYLMWFAIFFIGMFCFIFVGSAGYSKTFKVKNSIINTIDLIEDENSNNEAKKIIEEVDANLATIGYRVKVNECKDLEGWDNITENNSYDYCIYKKGFGEGYRYKVVTYMRIDFPLLNRINIPIYGETKTYEGDKR